MIETIPPLNPTALRLEFNCNCKTKKFILWKNATIVLRVEDYNLLGCDVSLGG